MLLIIKGPDGAIWKLLTQTPALGRNPISQLTCQETSSQSTLYPWLHSHTPETSCSHCLVSSPLPASPMTQCCKTQLPLEHLWEPEGTAMSDISFISRGSRSGGTLPLAIFPRAVRVKRTTSVRQEIHFFGGVFSGSLRVYCARNETRR